VPAKKQKTGTPRGDYKARIGSIVAVLRDAGLGQKMQLKDILR